MRKLLCWIGWHAAEWQPDNFEYIGIVMYTRKCEHCGHFDWRVE